MNALIVYYSMGGNTEFAATKMAERLKADLLKLEPVKAYPDKDFKKFLWGGKSAVMAEKLELKPYSFDPEKYDLIIFGFPVWAGNMAPPLRTFVSRKDLKPVRYAAFACQGGSGAEKAFEKLKACLGHDLEKTLILIDPKDKPDPAKEVQMEDFCDSLAGSACE